MVALGNLLAYSAERRNVLMYRLKETRAELARAAVAEERLRISRDLHDLLGHSLSLITLKAELASRVIGTDPERAAREIAELETVARRSLTEVRQAVTSYRQPSLAAELVSSRRMLASAGSTASSGCRRLLAAAGGGRAARVDGTGGRDQHRPALRRHAREDHHRTHRHRGLRQAVRRRHGTAREWPARHRRRHRGAAAPTDGVAAGGTPPGFGLAGSGLAGLAERAARLGGTLSAGAGEEGGFWLRVSVPLTGTLAGGAADPGPSRERMPS